MKKYFWKKVFPPQKNDTHPDRERECILCCVSVHYQTYDVDASVWRSILSRCINIIDERSGKWEHKAREIVLVLSLEWAHSAHFVLALPVKVVGSWSGKRRETLLVGCVLLIVFVRARPKIIGWAIFWLVMVQWYDERESTNELAVTLCFVFVTRLNFLTKLVQYCYW